MSVPCGDSVALVQKTCTANGATCQNAGVHLNTSTEKQKQAKAFLTALSEQHARGAIGERT